MLSPHKLRLSTHRSSTTVELLFEFISARARPSRSDHPSIPSLSHSSVPSERTLHVVVVTARLHASVDEFTAVREWGGHGDNVAVSTFHTVARYAVSSRSSRHAVIGADNPVQTQQRISQGSTSDSAQVDLALVDVFRLSVPTSS